MTKSEEINEIPQRGRAYAMQEMSIWLLLLRARHSIKA
jgi:hypothetical protein